jgi:uncharacterized membrane protein
MIALSDAVFAIVITILVLELKLPQNASFAALLSLWPQGLSYAVSYLFLAIVWVNHHYLLRYASAATHRLIWINFAHLFTVSLVPFATAWIAQTKLGGVSVAFYASIFVSVNVTYVLVYFEAVDRARAPAITARLRAIMRTRSIITLAVFAAAVPLALVWPIGGMALIGLCLVSYLRPEGKGPAYLSR